MLQNFLHEAKSFRTFTAVLVLNLSMEPLLSYTE
jgi:hypothetical protein